MKTEFEIESAIYSDAVDREAARLVREGFAPWQALEMASRIVRERRRVRPASAVARAAVRRRDEGEDMKRIVRSRRA